MPDAEDYNRRRRRQSRDDPVSESNGRSSNARPGDEDKRYRRRTEDYRQQRDDMSEVHRKSGKRSRSPARRNFDGSDEDNRHRSHKRRRSFDDSDRNRRGSRDHRGHRDDDRYSRRQRSPDGKNKHDDRQERKSSSKERNHRHSHHHRHSHRERSRSRSPRHAREPRQSSAQLPPPDSRRSKAPLPSQQDAFTSTSKPGNAVGPPIEKQKPNYNTSGKLAAETNTVAGTDIILKYNEPPEGRKPSAGQPWRMYEFKGENPDPLSTTELHTRSCWLFGRERAVVDFPIEHPSCSKQHAVIQFRFVEKKNEFGDRLGGVKPYVIDLESANGTRVNGERIPEKRFWEIKSGDMLGFGESTREYVIMLPPKE